MRIVMTTGHIEKVTGGSQAYVMGHEYRVSDELGQRLCDLGVADPIDDTQATPALQGRNATLEILDDDGSVHMLDIAPIEQPTDQTDPDQQELTNGES